MCRLTSVVRDQRREKDDEWSRRNEPLHRVRADGFAALIAHVVSCAIAMGPPLPIPAGLEGRTFEDVEGQFGAAPHRMEIVAALAEAAAVLSPRAPEAFRVAAWARNTAASGWLIANKQGTAGVSNGDAPHVPGALPLSLADAFDLAAEWYQRAALLLRPLRVAAVGDASGGAEGGGLAAAAPLLTWSPPPLPQSVAVDVDVNDQQVEIWFPMRPSRAIPPGPKPPPPPSSDYYRVGQAVWARYPNDEYWYGVGSESVAGSDDYVIGRPW